jgi:hypothetical protein
VASPIRILFASYAMHGSPSILGLIKRCLRLIDRLPLDRCAPVIVHRGWVPDDPFTRRVLSATPHVITSGVDVTIHIRAALAEQRPHVVVLCEPPLVGPIAPLARDAGADLVCVENLFTDDLPAHHEHKYPEVDRWLFLGIPAAIGFGRVTERSFVAPPLLPDPIRIAAHRPLDVLIQGYDLDVAQFGLELIRRLPRRVTAAIVLGADRAGELAPAVRAAGVMPIEFPDDPRYQQLLGSTRVMIGKDGFQQVVEALAVGTRVICRASPGGVGAILPAHFAPYVTYSAGSPPDWPALVRRAEDSLAASPALPWRGALTGVADATGFAVRGLGELLRDRPYAGR